VYYANFERQRLQELAGWLPQYETSINRILRCIWDLLPFVRDHVYHRRFRGSYSLKDVVPVIVPASSYEGLDVSDGTVAALFGIDWYVAMRASRSESV
jgi:hypothetical protein